LLIKLLHTHKNTKSRCLSRNFAVFIPIYPFCILQSANAAAFGVHVGVRALCIELAKCSVHYYTAII